MAEGRRGLYTLLVCQGVLVAGLALSFPFFALYLNRDRGIPMGTVGLALALVVASTAASQAWGGELSDLYGAKTVMEGALACRAVVAGGLALAVRWRAPVSVLVGLYVLAAFGGNFYDPAVRAWIAERYEPSERATLFGYQRIAGNIGWGIGPALGGVLAQSSYALLFAATALACLVCWEVLRAGVPVDVPARAGQAFAVAGVMQAARDSRLLEFCAYTMAISAVMTQLVASLSVHCVSVVGLSERQVGVLFGLNGAIVAMLQAPLTRAWRTRPLTIGLAAGCLLYAVGYGWVGFARTFGALTAAVAVVTLGEASVSPSLYTIAANLAPAGWRGRYAGFHGIAAQIGQALGPLLGGLALEHVTPRWPAGPWLSVAVLACLSAFGFARFARHLNDEEQGMTAPLGALEA